MPVFADKTRLAIAGEATWGAVPGRSDTFTLLPLTSEALAPGFRHIRPQSLSGVKRVAPVVAETVTGGEIEGIASAELLDVLLPYVMMANASVLLERPDFDANTGRSGQQRLTSVPAGIHAHDFVWVSTSRAEPGVPHGFYPLSLQGTKYYITDLPTGIIQSRFMSAYCKLGRAGAGLRSFGLMRKFGDDGGWTRFTGMCAERIVLDADQGSLATVTASLIGKETADVSASPRTTGGNPAAPLTLADDGHAFRISDGTNTLDHNALVLTGLRLVLERTGMAPRHVLGSAAPALITPGRLSVYGHLDVLVSDADLLPWLLGQNTLRIGAVLGDALRTRGVAFTMGRVRLTDIESLPRGDDELLAARFSFTGEYDDNDDVIRFFLRTGDN